MSHLASIFENLAVLCNPVWVVDSNREWMESTQWLLIAYQRIETLKNQISVINSDELMDIPRSIFDEASVKKSFSGTHLKNVTSQKGPTSKSNDAYEISLTHAKEKCGGDTRQDRNEWRNDISKACTPSSSDIPSR